MNAEERKERTERRTRQRENRQKRREERVEGGGPAFTSVQEVLDQQEDNRTGVEILEGAIGKLQEADALASSTMMKLETQKEQLLKMDDDLFTINDSLARSEYIMKGMQSISGKMTRGIGPKTKDTRYKGDGAEDRAEPQVELPPRPKAVADRQECYGPLQLPEKLAGLKKGPVRLEDREILAYYTNTSTKLIKDAVSDCLIMTNKRLINMDGGAIGRAVDFGDVLGARSEISGKKGKLIVAHRGKVTGFGGPNEVAPERVELEVLMAPESADFFEKVIAHVLTDLNARRKNRNVADMQARQAAMLKQVEAEQDESMNFDKKKKTTVLDGLLKPFNKNKEKAALDAPGGKAWDAVPEFQEVKTSDLEKDFHAQMDAEDKILDEMSGLVKGLKVKAAVMNTELDAHNKIIKHLDEGLDTTGARLKNDQAKVGNLLKKKGVF